MSPQSDSDGPKPVRWGILGSSKIARERVIPALRASYWCEPVAVSSRSRDTAWKTAQAFGMPKAYGSYEALLDDPDIEAIYNPLPNNLHVRFTLAAAERGKHVLCEKPIAMSAEEAQGLTAVPPGILVAEAFAVRHHPQWKKARDLVQGGAIGTPRAFQAFYSYHNVNAANIRNIPATGGGALMDIGCYPIVCARYVFDAEPRRVLAFVDRDPDFRTDRTTTAIVDFGEGRQLTFTASTQSAPFQRVQIVGTKARLEVELPFNAAPDRPMRLFLDDGSTPGGGSATLIEVPATDQFTAQATAFARAVRGIEPLEYGVADAILNMRVIDAIFRSERTGTWVEP